MRNVCKSALCLILVIFFLPLYGAAQTEPTLVMPVQVHADAGATVTMPVTYVANGNLISSMIFSVDFDETNLDFNPASTMGFPWPDAIAVNPMINPFVFSVGITYDATDTDGELDFTFSDINLPLSALPEGELVTITFTAGNPAADTNAPVRFSLDPTASFGNTDGASVPGVTVDGSVSITTICIPTDTVDTTCDGIDDDCDGAIDEDYVPIPTTCGVGECAASGQTTCVNGVEGDTCIPGTPSFEVCDCFFLDEDCDGLVDEICACICDEIRSCGSDVGECLTGAETCVGGEWSGICVGETGPSNEVCDNLDNDCDGSIDENLTRPTTCGVGECTGNTGEETCTAGMWGNDTCDPLEGAVPEVCYNSLDEDCDGVVDQPCAGCPVGETRRCGSDVGECVFGTETCIEGETGDGIWSGICDGWIGPSAEVCDNLDNDCDGSIDENLTRPTTCGVGECAGNTGEETCTAGMWGGDTCDPQAGAVCEVCDGMLDEDCDGIVDEVCDSCLDDRFCGSDVGACQNGIERCIQACEGNYWSGICEGEVGPAAEVCDNLDNDCDGAIDEDLSRPTTCGVGECAGNTGIQTCTAGTWGGNTCDPLAGAVPEVPGDTTCSDTLDNDCDGTTDLGDSSCLGDIETDCFDGIDNDGDGLTDCADPDCEGTTGGSCSTGNACTTGTRTCQSGAEVCVPANVPDGTACDDGLFCNGVEFCNEGTCAQGENPCPTCTVCDENQDICSGAPVDVDIVKFTVSGSKDKRNKGKTKTGGSANVGKPIRRIQLVVENPNGGCEQGALATITGVQDSKEVYNETRTVFDYGSGQARFAFPNYTPVKKGTIQWTAEVFDNDPDNDTATATTRVK